MDEVDIPEKYEHYRLEISKEQGPVRIDKYVVSKIKYATRNKVQNAIKDKSIMVNDLPVKVHYFIKPFDVITIFFKNPPNEKKVEGQNIPLKIIYEDDYLMVIDKPAGMLVHPTISVYKNTLLNALLYHFQNCNTPDLLESPGIVHRLDKDTSGLMIIAKQKDVLKDLGEQFFHHTIQRKYVALVYDSMKDGSGTINANIENNVDSNKAKISKSGKTAITHYKVLEKNKYLTIVECQLETGRTHQIRLHFEYLGHPLVNDPIYTGYKNYDFKEKIENKAKELDIKGQLLHSYYMKFLHPVSKEYLEFKTEIPQEFFQILNILD